MRTFSLFGLICIGILQTILVTNKGNTSFSNNRSYRARNR
jgi:hypothetical protein